MTSWKAINNATAGTITLNADTIAENYTDTAVKLAAALTGITTHTGDVTLTAGAAAATIDQLEAINNATAGTITLNANTIAENYTDTAVKLAAALTGITTHTGDVTLTAGAAAATIDQLETINNATAGTITLNDNTIAENYTDTAVKLAAALTGTRGHTGDVTLTAGAAAATIDQLEAINNATAGTITLNDNTIAENYTNTAVKLAAALTGITTHTGDVTLTVGAAAATIDQLEAINNATAGTITLNADTIAENYTDTAVKLAAALTGITTHTGDVTLTVGAAAATIDQLEVINNATAGTITLNADTIAENYTNTAVKLAAALTGITTHTGDVTLTVGAAAATIDQLEAINNATAGTITLNDNTIAENYTDTAVKLAAALTGTRGHTGDVTLTAGAAAATIDQLEAINNATAGTITLNDNTIAENYTDTAVKLAAALTGITTHTGDVTLTVGAAAATIDQLEVINNATAGTITLNADTIAENYTDTAVKLAAALTGITGTHTGDVTLTAGAAAATIDQLEAINNATAGTITLNANTIAENYTNTAVKLAAALTGITTHTGDVTLTVGAAAATIDQLEAINNATAGTITLNADTIAENYTNTAVKLAAALTGITTHTGDVTLTVGAAAATIDQLEVINNATAGTITLNDNTIAENYTNTAVKLAAALTGTTGHTGTVEITGTPPTVDQLNTISTATGGVVTATTSGTAAELALLTTGANDLITLTLTAGAAAATIDQLETINNATAGTITLNDNTIAENYTDTAVKLAAALTGTTGHTGTVTLTAGAAAATIDQLEAINNATAGTITLNDNTIAENYTNTAVKLAAALTGITTHTGDVTLTVGAAAATIDQLEVINNATAGTITLNANTIAENYTDTAVKLAAALTGITTHTGDVTLTAGAAAATIDQLETINNATAGTITLNADTIAENYTNTAVKLAAALTGITTHTGDVTLTAGAAAATIDQLEAINNATAGTITLNDNTIAENYTDTAVKLAAALTNTRGHTGDVTLTAGAAAATIDQLEAINNATAGTITLNDNTIAENYTDTAVKLAAALTGITTHTGDVTLTVGAAAATIDQLEVINNATAGTITLNADTIAENYTDTAVKLAAALTGITTHTGDVTLTVGAAAATIDQLEAINNATAGTITLNANTIAENYTNTAVKLAAALTGITTHTGDVTLTVGAAAATIDQLEAINNATAGTITLNDNTIAENYTDTAVKLAAALTGTTGHTGDVTLTAGAAAATIDQLEAINNATAGTITLNDNTIAENYTNTAVKLAAALTGITTHTGDVTLTVGAAAATIDQLEAINNATAGTITLNDNTIAENYTDTAVKLAAALTGTTGHTGTVEITGTPPTVDQLNTISTATGGVVTATTSGTAAELALLTTGANDLITLTLTAGAAAATIDQLETINNATAGTITLNDNTIAENYTDTAVKLAAALTGITTHTGDVTLTAGAAAATIDQLEAINNATAGTITLNDNTIAENYTDTAVKLAAALTGYQGTHWGCYSYCWRGGGNY